MKNLFEERAAEEVKGRLARLQPDSGRLWGRMDAAQAVAHCAAGLELALGDRRPPQTLFGRTVGRLLKPLALADDKPMRRNSPTVKGFEVTGERDLEAERRRLWGLIDRFVAGGPAGCTTHPHSLLGPLTPQEWAVLMYKHLDHHLRQFGA